MILSQNPTLDLTLDLVIVSDCSSPMLWPKPVHTLDSWANASCCLDITIWKNSSLDLNFMEFRRTCRCIWIFFLDVLNCHFWLAVHRCTYSENLLALDLWLWLQDLTFHLSGLKIYKIRHRLKLIQNSLKKKCTTFFGINVWFKLLRNNRS